MREIRPCGFVRGVLGDRHPYRGSQKPSQSALSFTKSRTQGSAHQADLPWGFASTPSPFPMFDRDRFDASHFHLVKRNALRTQVVGNNQVSPRVTHALHADAQPNHENSSHNDGARL
jgi:hypothetical protein